MDMIKRLNAQEAAAQRAARNLNRPVSVTWRHFAGTRDVPVRVRAKPKTIGYEMRYFVDDVQVTRRELVAALTISGLQLQEV